MGTDEKEDVAGILHELLDNIGESLVQAADRDAEDNPEVLRGLVWVEIQKIHTTLEVLYKLGLLENPRLGH